jgi:hypothetical protein
MGRISISFRYWIYSSALAFRCSVAFDLVTEYAMKKDMVETRKIVRIRPRETSFEMDLREDVSLRNN